jgi:hypothetical protein
VGFCELSVNINFPYRTMVRTRDSEVASSSARPRARWTHDPFQDALGTESNLEVVMEDVETDDTGGSGLDFRGPDKCQNIHILDIC